MEICNACHSAMDSGELICRICKEAYHSACVNFQNSWFSRKWVCPLCVSKIQTKQNGLETPHNRIWWIGSKILKDNKEIETTDELSTFAVKESDEDTTECSSELALADNTEIESENTIKNPENPDFIDKDFQLEVEILQDLNEFDQDQLPEYDTKQSTQIGAFGHNAQSIEIINSKVEELEKQIETEVLEDSQKIHSIESPQLDNKNNIENVVKRQTDMNIKNFNVEWVTLESPTLECQTPKVKDLIQKFEMHKPTDTVLKWSANNIEELVTIPKSYFSEKPCENTEVLAISEVLDTPEILIIDHNPMMLVVDDIETTADSDNETSVSSDLENCSMFTEPSADFGSTWTDIDKITGGAMSGGKVHKSDRKIGHRRVGEGGEITYKKIQSTQIMNSIQLGESVILYERYSCVPECLATEDGNDVPSYDFYFVWIDRMCETTYKKSS